MKKILIALTACLLIVSAGFSQSSKASFNTNDITWFGIDYTHCYFSTPIDFPNTGDLKAKLKAWNDLIFYEREKYIDKTLKGKNVKFSTEAIEEKNNTVDIKSRILDDLSKANLVQSDQIQEIINGYNIKDGSTGTGLVLIAESYNKPAEEGSYYVTFFDIATKKIFATEQMSGKANGFGLRNYWANTFYKVLQEVGKQYK
jgi:hypothetical protein